MEILARKGRVSMKQWDLLLDFLESHPELISGYNNTPQGRRSSLLLWNNIAEFLNAEESGPFRSGRDWATYVSNYKCKLKANITKKFQESTDKTDPTLQLTDIDTRLLTILGPTFGVGNSKVKVELARNETSTPQSNKSRFSYSDSDSRDDIIEEPATNRDDVIEEPATNSKSCTDPLLKSEDELLDVTETPIKSQTPQAKTDSLTKTSSSQTNSSQCSILDYDSHDDTIDESATNTESCSDPLVESEDDLLEATETPIQNRSPKNERNNWNLSKEPTIEVEPVIHVEEEPPMKVTNCWVVSNKLVGIEASSGIISPKIPEVKKQVPIKRTNPRVIELSDDDKEESVDRPVTPIKKVRLPVTPVQNLESRANDEFGLFGQTVAEKLRQLPLIEALETEEMILAVLRKQRVKVIMNT